jgi:hypothetical protein
MVVLNLARVGLYLWLASVDRGLVAHQTSALLSQARTGHQVISVLALVSTIMFVVLIALDIAWRSRRRPKLICTDYGEAYVESPTWWVTPWWLFASWAALAVGTIAFGSASAVHTGTLLAELPRHRDLAAVGATINGLLWASFILWVALANRSLDQRLARSTAYRADPSLVPYFPPVKRPGSGR